MLQGRGLQRMAPVLVHHIAPCDEAQLVINHRRQALESSLIAVTPGPQEARDFDRPSRRNVILT